MKKIMRMILFKLLGPGKIVGWGKKMVNGKHKGTFVHFERGIFHLEKLEWIKEL